MTVSYTLAAPLPEAPIEFRLARLASLFKAYAQLKEGETMVAGGLVSGGVTYFLSWKRIPSGSTSVVDCSAALEKAIAWGSRKLPKNLAPQERRLLSLGKYLFGEEPNQVWVWIAEFEVDDESPVAGTGYAPTLFIPISASGEMIVESRVR